MAYYQWTADLCLGNRFLDADHKHIIDLINALHDAMSNGMGDEIVGKTLFDLIVYCKGHFMREEDHMRRIGFSGYAQHKREHEKLLEQVNLLYERFKNDRQMTLIIEVATFLHDWLVNHILQSDLKIAESFTDSAAGARINVKSSRPVQ